MKLILFCGRTTHNICSEKSLPDSADPSNAVDMKYLKSIRATAVKRRLSSYRYKSCDRHLYTQYLPVMVARIVHITLVILYYCVAIGVSDIMHLMAIIYIVYPENVSVEPTEKLRGRNFIDAPLRCAHHERRDRQGHCREIYWTAYR